MTRQQAKHFAPGAAPKTYKDVMREAGMRVVKGTLSVALVASLVPTVPSVAYATPISTMPIVNDRPADDEPEAEEVVETTQPTEETQQFQETPEEVEEEPEEEPPAPLLQTQSYGNLLGTMNIQSVANSSVAVVSTQLDSEGNAVKDPEGNDVTTTLGSATYYTNNPSSVAVTVTKDDGDTVVVTTRHMAFGAPSSTDATLTGTDGTYTFNPSAGTTVVTVKVTSTADGEKTYEYKIVYDNTSLTVGTSTWGSETAVTGTTYRSRTLTLPFVANTDIDASSVSVVAKRTSAGDVTLVEAGSLSSLTNNKVDLSFTEDGTYESLVVTAKDACGNTLTSQTVDIEDFTIDVAPTATISEPSSAAEGIAYDGKTYYNADVTYTITVPADVATSSVAASIDGNAINVAWGADSADGSHNGTITLDSGSYAELKVSMTDAAGTVAETKSIKVVVDKLAPRVESVTIDRTATTRETTETIEGDVYAYTPDTPDGSEHATVVTVNLTDASGSGIDTVELQSADEGIVLDTTGITKGGTTGVAKITLTNGEHLRRGALLVVTDVAGNKRIWSIAPTGEVWNGVVQEPTTEANTSPFGTDIYAHLLVVDTVAPTIDFGGIDESAVISDSGNLTVTITEANFLDLSLLPTSAKPVEVTVVRTNGTETSTIATVTDLSKFTLVNGTTDQYQATIPITVDGSVTDGKYTVTAKVTDIANHSATATRTFEVDNTDPIIELAGATNGEYYKQDNAPRSVVVSVTDDHFDDTSSYVTYTVKGPDGEPVPVPGEDGEPEKDSDGNTVYTFTNVVNWVQDPNDASVWTQTVPVEGDGEYTFIVYACDKATEKNESSTIKNDDKDIPSVTFTIDTVAPKFTFSWDDGNEDAIDIDHDEGEYCADNQTLVVYVTEANWDGGTGKAVAKGTRGTQELSVTGSDWARVTTTDDDGNTVYVTDDEGVPVYQSTITFDEDYDYAVDVISVTDLAGNNSTLSLHPFTVDKTAPSIVPNRPPASGVDEEGTEYYNLPISMTFTMQDRNYKSETHAITATGATNADTIDFVEGETAGDGNVTYTATAYYDEGDHGEPYVYVEDYAGNFREYGGGTPFIVDLTAPVIDKVTVNHDPSAVGSDDEGDRQFFKEPTTVTIDFHDNLRLASGTAIVVENGQRLNDPDGVYSKDVTLTSNTNGTVTVTLEDGTTRSEDTEFERNVILTLQDVAGNVRTWSIDKNGTVTDYHGSATANTSINGEGAYPLALIQDLTAPKTSLSGVTAGSYYNSTQTVHAQIDEFNFGYLQRYDGGRAVMHVTKWEGNAGRAQSSWEIPASSFAGSGSAWGFNQAFADDGHYVVEVSFDDIAGNPAQVSRIEEFTIDKTAPTITVNFDNNDVQNGKYYKAGRTATVTIVEHNFDASLINITTEGSVGSWSSSGDTHTLQISYATDGDYTLTISGRDRAGNSFATYTADPFTIDLTAPTITISGVEDAHAYGGDVMPVISFEDEKNFDANGCQWTLRGLNVSSEAGAAYAQSTATTANGQTVSYANFANDISVDDIYVLEANLTDLAGNTAQASVTFSVNRFGSNFMIVDANKYTTDDNRGVMAQAPTIQVVEINVSGVEGGQSSVVVSQGMKPSTLEEHEQPEDTGYTVESGTDDDSGWSRYVYTIASGNFDDEGEYEVVVRSDDNAGNKNQSSEYYEHFNQSAGLVKHAAVSFVIDKTAPQVEGLSIADAQVYEENGTDVTFTVIDNVGYDDADVKVTLSGKSGSEEVVLKRLEDGTYSFYVDESAFDPRTVAISVADWAGNVRDLTVSNFRVTTNIVELHLPWIIGGVAVVGGGAVGGAALWRRRKDDEEENPTIR